MEIGFAGLGRMGRPMVRHLAQAGHQVLAYDPAVPPGAVPAELDTAGVVVVGKAADLAGTDVSVSMLPDAATTEALLLGEGGFLPGCRPSHVHIVMGTVGAAAVRRLAEAARAVGATVVDAPVSGSVGMAETATTTAMVGAEPAVFGTVQPVLAAMTRAQFHTGPVGSGSAAKLAVNLVLASLNQAVGEAIATARADGLDPAAFYDVLQASAVAAPYLSYKREHFLRPAEVDVAFPISLLDKDVRLGLELARGHGLQLPVATVVAHVLERARRSGLDDLDMTEVQRLLLEPEPLEER